MHPATPLRPPHHALLVQQCQLPGHAFRSPLGRSGKSPLRPRESGLDIDARDPRFPVVRRSACPTTHWKDMANFSVLCPGDELIQRLVPNYSQIVDLMVQLLAAMGGPRSVLDLGAGPGRVAEAIHRRFSQARLTLLDASPDVLEIARRRLPAADATFVVGDYTRADLGRDYDAIAAGLTLHHLDDDGKRAMAGRLYDALADGGVLVVSDIVRGSTPAWDRWYEAMWLDHIADVAQEDEYVLQHYREHDHPATVEDQLRWLQQAGFAEVACHWRHLNFAVYSGRRGARG